MIPVLNKKSKYEPENLAEGFIVLFNKDVGWTSFDVVKKIRYFLKIKKVGHAGTLDPFATGLLILGVGKGTKELEKVSASSKCYETEICFGKTTDTYDRTGVVVSEKATGNLTIDSIETALEGLRGEIEQVPPMYSAKKVDGVRLYKLARKQIEVERKAVPITIFEACVLSWQNPLLKMHLNVSKGTYIRSYAYDLGEKLKCGAYLESLTRTSIGKFLLEDSFTVDEFMQFWNNNGRGFGN